VFFQETWVFQEILQFFQRNNGVFFSRFGVFISCFCLRICSYNFTPNLFIFKSVTNFLVYRNSIDLVIKWHLVSLGIYVIKRQFWSLFLDLHFQNIRHDPEFVLYQQLAAVFVNEAT
jgi:hypothetical protein